MKVIDVFQPPPEPKLNSTPTRLLWRALSKPISNAERIYSPGFTPDVVRSMHIVKAFKHGGCVNTANFNEAGSLLATASDDLFLHIWRSSTFMEDATSTKAKYEVPTIHTNNIFHTQFSPRSDNIILTSAADGHILLHDLNQPSGGRQVASFRGMANMFDFQTPDIICATNLKRTILTAGGLVEVIDLRTPSSNFTLVDSDHMQIKALAVCPWDQNYLAVGVDEELWICDTRLRNMACVVEKMTLEGVFRLEEECKQKFGVFVPLQFNQNILTDVWPVEQSYASFHPLEYTEKISISSIEFSKNAREILVSYQGDAIYRFKMDPSRGFDGSCIDNTPVQFFSGHVNCDTFLKRASFFGPNEEYVCCGGDDGSVFIFDSSSGELLSCKKGDGFNSLGRGIVNGVVPHPFSNCFVSYGLDPHAKLWVPKMKEPTLEDEKVQDDESNLESNDDNEIASEDDEFDDGSDEPWKSDGRQSRRRIAKSMTLCLGSTVSGQYTVASPCCTMVRSELQRRKAIHRFGGRESIIPSTSLVIAALEDGDLSVLDEDGMGASRIERCIAKVEQMRETGNEHFHDSEFEDALNFYSVGAHYCICAEATRYSLIRALEIAIGSGGMDNYVKEGLHSLKSITKLSGMAPESKFEFMRRRSGYTNTVISVPGEAELNRIVAAFIRIRQLLLTCTLNAAQAALKLEDNQTAYRFATRACSVDEGSVKAHYRLAMALRGRRMLREAINQLEIAAKLPDGNTPLVLNALRDLRARVDRRRGATDS